MRVRFFFKQALLCSSSSRTSFNHAEKSSQFRISRFFFPGQPKIMPKSPIGVTFLQRSYTGIGFSFGDMVESIFRARRDSPLLTAAIEAS